MHPRGGGKYPPWRLKDLEGSVGPAITGGSAEKKSARGGCPAISRWEPWRQRPRRGWMMFSQLEAYGLLRRLHHQGRENLRRSLPRDRRPAPVLPLRWVLRVRRRQQPLRGSAPAPRRDLQPILPSYLHLRLRRPVPQRHLPPLLHQPVLLRPSPRAPWPAARARAGGDPPPPPAVPTF